MKTTWKVINSIIKKKIADNRNESKKFQTEGKTPTDVANSFNELFTEIGPNLASKISPTSCKVDDFLKHCNLQSMFLNPITEKELLDIVNTQQSKQSKDYLGLSMNIVKQVAPNILASLVNICNKSFKQGIFPNK